MNDQKALLIAKILGKKATVKKFEKRIKKNESVEALQDRIVEVLAPAKEPVRGCRLAEQVNKKCDGFEEFVKEDGQWRAGQLERILAIPGIVMLKPKSEGNTVITDYSEVNIKDTTPVFFVFEKNWNGKLPTV